MDNGNYQWDAAAYYLPDQPFTVEVDPTPHIAPEKKWRIKIEVNRHDGIALAEPVEHFWLDPLPFVKEIPVSHPEECDVVLQFTADLLD